MAKQTVAEKRDGEKLLVSEMIALYCRKNHHMAKGCLCPQCQALHDYALQRIERCPFMETKTFCSACKVHCYKPEMREQIRVVMRWSGPRMLFVHPVLAHEGDDEGEKGEMSRAGGTAPVLPQFLNLALFIQNLSPHFVILFNPQKIILTPPVKPDRIHIVINSQMR